MDEGIGKIGFFTWAVTSVFIGFSKVKVYFWYKSIFQHYLFVMFRQCIKVIVTNQFYCVSGLFLLCVSFNLVCWITSFRMCCYAEVRWNKKNWDSVQWYAKGKQKLRNHLFIILKFTTYKRTVVLLRLLSVKFQLLYLFLHIRAR